MLPSSVYEKSQKMGNMNGLSRISSLKQDLLGLCAFSRAHGQP